MRNPGQPLVYAMQVTETLSMSDYDACTASKLIGKRPMWDRCEWWRRLGDSIYDYSDPSEPTLRKPCVHSEANMKTDLSGKNALLSTHFFYFGDRAIDLPKQLLGIVQQQQGHRKDLNDPFIEPFVQWINNFGYAPRLVIGKPLYNPMVPEGSSGWGTSWGASRRLRDNANDLYLVDDQPMQALD